MNRLPKARVLLGLLAAATALVLVPGSTIGAPSAPSTLTKVLADSFADGLGYHASAVEPSIASAPNPARAGAGASSSTIVATTMVGVVFGGGASDIGYAVSDDGGQSWRHGLLPLTVQGGMSDTCAGALNRAGDPATAYDKRHDVWLASSLGFSHGANVAAVYVDRGTVDFATGDIDWGPPICTHVTQPSSDAPDKPWITCDNWPTSKGYGNCYLEYDNNGNGNRVLMQVTHDGGQTWDPAPDVNANAAPGNGNSGDVVGETTLVCPTAVTACAGGGANAALAGDTNIKVASVTNINTTLAAAAAAGDTNIKVASVAVFKAGQQVNVDTGAELETGTVQAVGTAGPGGTGVTLTAPLALAHAGGSEVNTPIKVEVDFSGGNQEIVLPTDVGTAGPGGTGITFTPALARAHWIGVHVASAAANQSGHTGDVGGVPLVQPPPPGATSGSVCGRVVVPVQSGGVSWFSSSDCGAHWSAETQITPNMTATHTVAQGIRTSLLPASAMDRAGNIYLVWQTRSFRVGGVASTPNDIAMSVMPAPTDAQPNPAFAAPARIPIESDNTNSNTNDHFIPGIAADPNTSGGGAHLGLFYYNLPVAACAYIDPASPDNQCDLRVGFVSSTDGGATWSDPTYLADMALPNIVRSSAGPMVGDYSTATVIPSGPNSGNGISAFAVGVTDTTLDEAMYVPAHGLSIGSGPPTLTSVVVTPANPTIARGADQQFTATGTYSDGSSADITSSVTWASGNQAVATISAGGLAHAVDQGTSTISATSGDVEGDTLLTVEAKVAPVLTYTGPTSAAPRAAFTLSATLETPQGQPLPGKTVTFTLNGKSLNAKTTTSGVASVKTRAPATDGSYPIAIRFAGDSTYAPASSSAALSVAKLASALSYTGPTSASPAASITLSAILQTPSGQALAGKTLTFTFNGKILRAKTSSSGVASVKTTAPSAAGSYPVNVSFAGDATYTAASDGATLTVG